MSAVALDARESVFEQCAASLGVGDDDVLRRRIEAGAHAPEDLRDAALQALDEDLVLYRVINVLMRWRDWCDDEGRSEKRLTAGHINVSSAELSAAHRAAERYMKGRAPDRSIRRVGRAYLERWHLARSDAGCVYLHRFAGDDPDVGLHDHPWSSASLLLAGRQCEVWRPGGDTTGPARAQSLCPGTVSYRPAEHAHQLGVLFATTPITVFVTGARIRPWGFWVERPGAPCVFMRRPPELAEAAS